MADVERKVCIPEPRVFNGFDDYENCRVALLSNLAMEHVHLGESSPMRRTLFREPIHEATLKATLIRGQQGAVGIVSTVAYDHGLRRCFN